MGSRGEGGLKRNGQAAFGFCGRLLFAQCAKLLWGCEMVSHIVRNWFGVRNFLHAMRKFRKVCELISQGLAYFH